MKFRPGKIIFYMVAALFFIATAIFLLSDHASIPDYEPDPESKLIPSFNMDVDRSAGGEILFYPANPAPGDFLIVETGPFDSEVPVEIKYDFPGVISEYYRAGELLYAIIAIGFDAAPGNYHMMTEVNSARLESDTLVAEITITEKNFSLSRFSMPPDRTVGWTAARLAEDREKVRLARETTEPYPLWLQTFVPPLEGRITSAFGAIRIINENPPRRHNGIDIAADEGTPVVAPNSGIVRLAEFLLSGGNTVIIDHGIGISSTYMHLHTIAVEVGQTIDRGELIGTVGMTGYATGNHLHWEVNIGQTPVNPEQLMRNELLWIAPAYVANLFSAERQD